MRPAAIIERLDLRRPIFQRTAAYGHFGRTDGDGFTWENVEPYADELRRGRRRVGAPRLRGLASVGSLPTSPRSNAPSTTSFPTRSTRWCASARSCACRCTAGGCGAGSSPTTSTPERRRAPARRCSRSSSDGPPADVVALSDWIAWRWRGPGSRSCAPRRRPTASRPPLDPDPAWTQRPVAGRLTPVRRGGAAAAVARPAGAGRVDVRGRRVDDRRASPTASRARVARAVPRAARARTVALLHSDDPTRRARTDAWRRARAGDCVVVGGRIAALAPVPDLAAAIVVDDADEALQEERSPTWHARDVLLERARTRRRAVHGGARRRRPSRPTSLAGVRASTRRRPTSRRGLAARRSSSTGARSRPGAGLLTEPLADALRDAGGLAVCVLNRRGRFRLLVCDVVPRAAALGPRRRATAGLSGVRRDPAARAARRRHRVARGAGRARSRAAVSSTSTPTPTRSGDADIVVGTEAVLHRPEVRRRRPDARRVPRPRPGAARAALPRRRAGALAARRAARSSSRAARARRRAAARADPHARSRGRARARRAASPRSSPRPRSSAAGRSAIPPFGALAELTGDDAAARASPIDALRGARRDPTACGARADGTRAGARARLRTRSPTRSPAVLPRGRARRPHPRRRRPATRLTPQCRGGGREPIGTMAAMATHTIRVFGDPVLKRPAAPVDRHRRRRSVKLVDAMYETMYEAPGVGLAAPQVGVQKRFFVYDVDDETARTCCSTPRSSKPTGEWNYEEGCLSLPGLAFEIVRPKVVTVQGLDLDGNEVVVAGRRAARPRVPARDRPPRRRADARPARRAATASARCASCASKAWACRRPAAAARALTPSV